MISAADRAASAEEVLRLQIADAWFEYKEATENLEGARYLEVESWLYAQLQTKLRALNARIEAVAA